MSVTTSLPAEATDENPRDKSWRSGMTQARAAYDSAGTIPEELRP